MTKIVSTADSVMSSQTTAVLRRDGSCHAARVAARRIEALLSIGGSSCLLVLPIRVFWVFQVPERAAAAHHRQRLEVVLRRRRGRGPFERPGVPGVIARRRTAAQRDEQIGDETEETQGLEDRADRGEQVVYLPPAPYVIGVNAPRHTQDAGHMLRVKRQVEPECEQPEMPEAQCLARHAAARLRIPVVHPPKEREEQDTGPLDRKSTRLNSSH